MSKVPVMTTAAGVPVADNRQVAHSFRADPEYGAGVATGLGIRLAEAPGPRKLVVLLCDIRNGRAAACHRPAIAHA
jgi:hypothetical protein